ncbi:tail tubular protein A [Xanthomonas phage PBR31]|uniref:Tail tubular protein A n=1 Tax=Xanthomonas phage PPDBI TaxID=2723911 RepID=A0A6H0X5Q3_9CAUD|nr:hypothetical protein [Ralstonia pickettii]NYS10334.1 hypothetical protein [Ralstonia pickettii]QIN95336.1 tail tubular protein A [Xanthomonas phage PBR31]QIW89384.1 tail tubular protein A [Xanthomonas phage PPDBI]
MSDTALDIIKGALRRINELAAGETPDNDTATDALSVLNDLLDSLSNEHLACYQRVENILTLVSGKNIYTVGNPVGGTFLGTTVQNSNVISGVTPIPANLVLGGDISGAGIPAGATVTAIGANTVTMSLNATATYSTLESITYTTPGDFKVNRPLRVVNGFTRLTTSGISQVDYPLQIISVDQWSAIGLKNQPGPWPKVLYYDQAYPLGTMYFFPNPSQGGELHLWTDNLFIDYAMLNTPMNLPQGYERFLKVALALELWPEYRGSAPMPDSLTSQYRIAKAAVKNLNAQAQSVATYDHGIAGRAKNDAGWILHGGFV